MFIMNIPKTIEEVIYKTLKESIDRDEISITYKKDYFNILSHFIGNSKITVGEIPFTIVPYGNNTELKKHLLYFLNNLRSIQKIQIKEKELKIYFNYLQNELNIKENPNDTRLQSVYNLDNIKETLYFTEHGYLVEDGKNMISVIHRNNPDIQGHGYDPDPKVAERKAYLEYLERLASTYKLPGKIEGTYFDLKEQAIHPQLFGLYPEDVCYNHGLVKYHDELKLEWCKSKSLLTGKDYLIPEQLVQYLSPILNQYVYESSNGSSIGNSYFESLLYSTLEAVERDIFMKFWFGNLGVKQIIFDDKQQIYQSRKIFLTELGYDLNFYYIDSITDIPLIWCLITSNSDDNLVYSITGLSCHLNVGHAIKSAYNEATNGLLTLLSMDQSKLKKKILSVEQKGFLSTIMDHVYYFASNSSKKILEKRIDKVPCIEISELYNKSFSAMSIKEELDFLLRKIKSQYKDILVVDQTNEFINNFSLKCTKIILLGSLPLDWTSDLIRSSDIEENSNRIIEKNLHPLG
ncbi:YcaO-like family protein [Lysinibacillus fusiformis]|uniref:YcaO-like family protein n=1 Tax=Lysinibacillus fusiformis TaxID=28031 RepID=UPI003D000304